MIKMEILIHELLHMFEKQVLMLSVFYLKKFIVKVSVKTRETHFSSLLLLDPLLIQVNYCGDIEDRKQKSISIKSIHW